LVFPIPGQWQIVDFIDLRNDLKRLLSSRASLEGFNLFAVTDCHSSAKTGIGTGNYKCFWMDNVGATLKQVFL
jgi:hypothetical protein